MADNKFRRSDRDACYSRINSLTPESVDLWSLPGRLSVCDLAYNRRYDADFPVPSSELAKRLADTSIKGVGIDAISVDKISGLELPNHVDLLSRNKIIIENLKNLDLLVDKKFELFCFPLKIKQGDGSPIRAVARVIE